MKQTVGDIVRTELTESQSVMAIMIPYHHPEHEPGDFKCVYDRTKPEELAMAKETYDKWKKKGYMAYRVTGEKAEKGEVLSEFDPDARSIIFAPPMRGGSMAHAEAGLG